MGCACVSRRRVTPFALKRANQFIPPNTTTFLFDQEPSATDYKLQVLAWLILHFAQQDATRKQSTAGCH